MSPQAWLALGLLAAAVALMLWDRVPLDLLGLSVPVALVVLGLASPGEVFQGFANPAVLALLFIFMITRGLERTGATTLLAQGLVRLSAGSPRRTLPVVTLATALLSLTMNTVAAAAVALGPTQAVARRLNLSPRRLLLPVAYAALLGGMATLLTTANLIADAALRQVGLPGFSLFSFLPVGLPATAVGLLFLWWAAPRLLPAQPHQAPRRTGPLPDRIYRLEDGLHALRVLPESPLVGRSAYRPHLARALGLTPLGRLSKRGFEPISTLQHQRLQVGDVLVVAGHTSPEVLQQYGLQEVPREHWLASYLEHVSWMEATLHPYGQAAGRTPQELRLRERYGVLVVALWRQGRAYHHALYRMPLQQGDALLLQGPPEGLEALAQDPDFLPLSPPHPRYRRGPVVRALAWWALVLFLAGVVQLPLAWSVLVGVVGMAWSGLLPLQEAYRAVEWRSVFLIAGFLPLGQTLVETGALDALLRVLLPQERLPLPVILALLVAMASLLAQVLSGQVSALVLVPLALVIAQQQGHPPRVLAMAVAVGASMAFLLPTGHPANLLVFGPGGYQARDYLRLGLPLTLVVYPVLVVTLWLLGG